MENFIRAGILYYRGGSIPVATITKDLDISIEAIRHRLGKTTAWRKLEKDLLREKHGIGYDKVRNELFKES